MFKRTIQAALFIVAVTSMLVPYACQNIAAAGNQRTTTYNLYFGDLHAHTSYSDGVGTPWDAFAQAKAGGADFFATTDHVHYPYGQVVMTPELWADTQAAARYYTSSDFVAMAGYELWLPYDGEVNVYNTDTIYRNESNPGGHGYNNGLHESTQTVLETFYDWAAKTGAIGQWNHPSSSAGPFERGFNNSPLNNFRDFAFYSPYRDEGMSLLENFGTPEYEFSYIMALDAGWHVMPAANSDTHSADWITGYELRTVLLAPSLTPNNLYDAMKANRGYATQDSNLRITYTLNGAIMGSILSPSGPSYVANIHIEDPDKTASDAITMVEIVSDGGQVVARIPADANKVDLTVTLSSTSAHYFYVRVTTMSNQYGVEGFTAWTAPVWTGR